MRSEIESAKKCSRKLLKLTEINESFVQKSASQTIICHCLGLHKPCVQVLGLMSAQIHCEGPSMLWLQWSCCCSPSLWLPWQTLDANWHTVEISPIDRRVMVPTPAVGWPYLDVANTRERKWFLPDCSVPTVKFGGDSVMVLGCFSWFGVGSLVLMAKTMNDVHCLDVLDNYCTANIWQYFGGRPLLPTRQHTVLLRLLQSG